MPFVPPGIGLQVDKELRIVTKVRSKETFQKMADIPKERPVPSPLLPTLEWMFSVHGRWSQGKLVVPLQSNGEYFLLVLSSVHIEVIDSLSSSIFINSLRRFISNRKNYRFRFRPGHWFLWCTDDLWLSSSFYLQLWFWKKLNKFIFQKQLINILWIVAHGFMAVALI